MNNFELISDEEIKIAKEEVERLSWTHKAHPAYEKDKFLLLGSGIAEIEYWEVTYLVRKE